MLRILTDRSGIPRNGIGTEVPIIKQRGKWLVIESTTAVQQLFGGEVIEIYRPQASLQNSFEPYYDIPGGIVEIIEELIGAAGVRVGADVERALGNGEVAHA